MVLSKVMLNIEQFEIGQSYVTAKIENRHGDIINLNIQGGHDGIELQETLFNIKGKKVSFVYFITRVRKGQQILVRKLPVIGTRDWLLIYEDTLFLLAVKDEYDEIEMLVV
jgi:hypothetical protein